MVAIWVTSYTGQVLGLLTHLVDKEMGATSEPCCMREPVVNQKLLERLNWFSSSSGSSMHGYGLSHSYGENLARIHMTMDTMTNAGKAQSRT